jgi:hypothetical protein
MRQYAGGRAEDNSGEKENLNEAGQFDSVGALALAFIRDSFHRDLDAGKKDAAAVGIRLQATPDG